MLISETVPEINSNKMWSCAMSDAAPSRSINGTVENPRPNRRQKDRLRGGRKHLTETEIDNLMKVARKENRHGHRDATAIMIGFRHGLRPSELCNLQWTQVDFQRGTLQVHRRKNGTPSLHYLNGTELPALRAMQRPNGANQYVFLTERGDVVSTAWLRKMFARVGVLAGTPFPINPHMLRHACGFKFANEGKDTRSLQGYLGHRNIQSTTVYTALSPDRFRGWETE
jgi:integrase